MLLLAIAAGPAGAQRRPPCINADDPCGDPNVVTACEAFRLCQEELRDAVSTCVEDTCQCSEDRPNCRFPITPGRCTITLNCVHKCYRDPVVRELPSTRVCLRDLKAALRGGDTSCRVSSAAARRACKACVLPIPNACTPAFEDRGSRCQHDCVLRTLEKLSESKNCYSRCGSRCEGNNCATAMCERACRDSVCKKLRRFCSSPDADDGETGDDGASQRPDGRYQACCNKDNADCDLDSEDTLFCTPTTTSSTSTSTSTSSSSTVTSRPTTTTSTLAITATTLAR